ncbi:hypothetical protein [Paeniglutamicibacter kerguelensis]|uniref:DUF2269 family protein n=1 Tax=Paeniglutamicibacter kerguelensis TaxID=254788 RepID=A0ABS4XAG4_9MICC|nr:hypothetical protein [Paeniglutamicibacter kerguelensis]MBP2385455.1 hypothetical protein [Paeniglutamicibacter kerguelensis]
MIDSLAQAPAAEQPVLPVGEVTSPEPAPSRKARASRALRASGKAQARRAALAGLCMAGWSASVLVGHNMDTAQEVHRIGLAVHILALVISFGTILVIDWIGLLWLMGKREIHEPGRLESAAKPLIWGGLAMLLASGAFINPDLGSIPTRVKLVCVLVLMLNGLAIAPLMHWLLAMPSTTRFGEVARGLRARLMVALTVSQACWWTAVLIGLLNSTLRRWTGN